MTPAQNATSCWLISDGRPIELISNLPQHVELLSLPANLAAKCLIPGAQVLEKQVNLGLSYATCEFCGLVGIQAVEREEHKLITILEVENLTMRTQYNLRPIFPPNRDVCQFSLEKKAITQYNQLVCCLSKRPNLTTLLFRIRQQCLFCINQFSHQINSIRGI